MKKFFLLSILVTACELPPTEPSPTQSPTPTPTVIGENPKADPKPNPPTTTPPANNAPKPSLNKITDLVGSSKCAQYSWKDRGKSPLAYLQGVSLTYARALCQPNREDVKLVSAPRKLPEPLWDYVDSLSWYNSNFNALGLSNDNEGVETLRNSYTLLIGLGMRESSGRYCLGRDMSGNYSTADTAEAGLFQASWGAHYTNPALLRLHKKYQEVKEKCFLEVFSKNVSCSAQEAKNWGTGEGVNWQKMTKECPAYAVDYSAVLLRTSGGSQGEFGPLRRKEAELNLNCHEMLKQVESVIKAEPQICTLF
jgi:hypothetical protein